MFDDINKKNENGDSAIIVSCIHEDVEEVKSLISKGADVDSKNVDGKTPLIWSSITDNVEIMKLLISAGANLDSQDDEGETALHYACTNLKTTKLLIGYGCDLIIKNKKGWNALENLKSCIAKSDDFNKDEVIKLLKEAIVTQIIENNKKINELLIRNVELSK